MNIKIRAGLLAAGLIAAFFSAFALTHYALSAMTADQIEFLLSAGAVGVVLWLAYSVALAHLEYHEKLKEITNKYKNG